MAEIKISAFTQRLNEYSLTAISYNSVLAAAISGRLPAVLRGNRWFIDDIHIQHAVALFARTGRKVGRRATSSRHFLDEAADGAALAEVGLRYAERPPK